MIFGICKILVFPGRLTTLPLFSMRGMNYGENTIHSKIKMLLLSLHESHAVDLSVSLLRNNHNDYINVYAYAHISLPIAFSPLYTGNGVSPGVKHE